MSLWFVLFITISVWFDCDFKFSFLAFCFGFVSLLLLLFLLLMLFYLFVSCSVMLFGILLLLLLFGFVVVCFSVCFWRGGGVVGFWLFFFHNKIVISWPRCCPDHGCFSWVSKLWFQVLTALLWTTLSTAGPPRRPTPLSLAPALPGVAGKTDQVRHVREVADKNTPTTKARNTIWNLTPLPHPHPLLPRNPYATPHPHPPPPSQNRTGQRAKIMKPVTNLTTG